MSTATLIEIMRSRGLTISTAESLTAGGIGYELTSVSGASAVYIGGVNAYDAPVKTKVLGVQPQTIDEYGVVSEQTALEMAIGVQNLIPADISISTTGVAGPGPSGNAPEGRVCFGFVTQGKQFTKIVKFGSIGRGNVRERTVEFALNEVMNWLDSAC